MAARGKKGTDRARASKARSRASGAQAALIDNVQQIWLAGMGAIAMPNVVFYLSPQQLQLRIKNQTMRSQDI